MNSSIFDFLLKAMNPTINSGAEIVAQIPMVINKEVEQNVSDIVKQNVAYCKKDWDSFETSWDFQHHPLLRKVPTIVEAFGHQTA